MLLYIMCTKASPKVGTISQKNHIAVRPFYHLNLIFLPQLCHRSHCIEYFYLRLASNQHKAYSQTNGFYSDMFNICSAVDNGFLLR